MAARVRGLTERDEAEWARFAGRIAPLRRRRGVAPPEPSLASQGASQGTSKGRLAAAPATTPATAGPQAFKTPPSRPSNGPPPLGIDGQPPGVDTATWRRLHRGQLDGVRKLDLHGMTAQHAFAALRAFLRTAHAERVRCVEVVTGRGGESGGVLRRELPHWLNLPEIRPMVLAAAHPRTSGALHSHIANPGSVRLLIRRQRT
jgi:DNA-nicking Smr family endonuclease